MLLLGPPSCGDPSFVGYLFALREDGVRPKGGLVLGCRGPECAGVLNDAGEFGDRGFDLL